MLSASSSFQQLRRYWRVFWLFRSMRFQALAEYQLDFFFWIAISIIWTAFNFFFVSILASVSGEIAGWTLPELYVLLSLYTIFDSFTWGWFYSNMRAYTAAIFSGQFDQLLLKPIDTQFLILFSHNNFTHLPRFLIGWITLIFSLLNLDYSVSVLHILAGATLLLLSITLSYSLWFAIATAAFWVDKLDSIHDIFPGLRRVSQVPRQVFQGFSSVLFTLVLPLGLVTTIPSEVMLGKSEAGWVVYFICSSVAMALFARWFFQVSIKKYSGVGS